MFFPLLFLSIGVTAAPILADPSSADRRTPASREGPERVTARRILCPPLGRYLYVLEPTETQPKGQIVFLHGICEHGLRHVPLARRLAAHGYRVLLFDHRGHGLSVSSARSLEGLVPTYLSGADPREQVEAMRRAGVDKTSFTPLQEEYLEEMSGLTMQDHVDDVLAIVEYVYAEGIFQNTRPLFLGGHSMGGLLALESARRLEEGGRVRPEGVIGLNPALRPTATPKGKTWIGGIQALVESALLRLSWLSRSSKGWAPVRALIDTIAESDRRVDTHWVSEFVTDIPEERRFYELDPLIGRAATLRYLTSIEELMFDVLQRADRLPCPILLFYGTEDKIVSPSGCEAFMEAYRATHPDGYGVAHPFNGFGYHLLDRCSKREVVFYTLIDWLGSRIR